jgi:polysaccharide biosynthesis/export protein
VRIQDVAMSAEGEGRFRLSVKASAPLPASSCRFEGGGSSSLLILEFPRTESALKPSYDFPGMPVGTIRIEASDASAEKGVRIEVPLRGATFRGWESAGESIGVLLAGPPPSAASNASGQGPYRLGAGDRLTLAVFGHDDMKQDLEVLTDGTVVLPLLGVLPVAGRTLADVRSEMESRLKDYLVDPQVTLDIKEYRSQPVNVVGEVKNPGQYYLKGPTTLVDIIAMAGWMTTDAGSEVMITRHETGQDKSVQIRQILIGKEELVGSGTKHNNPLVQAGDVVTVGPKEFFYIRGEVSKPGRYPLQDHPTLMKAISIAEGLTPYARKKGIELIRTTNGVQTKTVVDLKAVEEHKIEDIPLLADDQILVPRRMF